MSWCKSTARYFGMKTGCFRGGCLTGPNHAGDAVARISGVLDEVRCFWSALYNFWLQEENKFATTFTARI